MTAKPHEALALPLSERVHYLMVVASMAAADVVLASAELEKIRALCAELGLPDAEVKEIVAVAHRPTASVERHLEALGTSELRFALLSDCISLAYADGEYGEEEQQEVRALAQSLQVTDEQLAAMEEFVRTAREAALAEGAGDHHGAGAAMAEKLASVGIPVGVVAAVSALGLEMAGVSTGLAAFGMGLGIATGFGAAVGLGVGTYMGVRWLKGRLGGEGGS